MKKLGIIKFGKALLETGDLDPIYIMLWKAKDKLGHNKLYRWLLAYWWFYHAGVASTISALDGLGFYERALRLAQTKGTPRGTERRHFRGQACVNSIDWFSDHCVRPESAVERLIERCDSVDDVLHFVKNKWPLFGPWIGFKIADMLERLDIAPIKFPIKTLDMYSEPTKGAALAAKRFPKLWSENQDDPPPDTTDVVKHLIKVFSKYKAPPRYERPVNVQEIETILCKWKSHLNGHYPVGKDTKEIKHALRGWGKTAEMLRSYLP